MRRALRCCVTAALALCFAVGWLFAVPTSASADPLRGAPAPQLPQSAGGLVQFGVALDWFNDSASRYSSRLGLQPPVFAHTAYVPFGPTEDVYLPQFFEQLTRTGAVAVVTLLPRHGFSDVDARQARDTARSLARWSATYRTKVYVEFAPGMNAVVTPYGGYPAQFRRAFRQLALAVHAESPRGVMVWTPAVTWDALPGEYERYYPGDDVVDWVGARVAPRLDAPQPAREVDASLRAGNFYDRYVVSRAKPLLVTTSGYVDRKVGAKQALRLQRAWWKQVFTAVQVTFPRSEILVWDETRQTGGAGLDGRVTNDRRAAGALAHDLREAGLGVRELRSPRASWARTLLGSRMAAAVALAIALGAFLLSGAVVMLRRLPTRADPRAAVAPRPHLEHQEEH